MILARVLADGCQNTQGSPPRRHQRPHLRLRKNPALFEGPHWPFYAHDHLTPVGTTIYQGIQARDIDAGVNGLVEYTIVPGDGKNLTTTDGVGRSRITVGDGYGFFAINLPHQGQVTVNRSLDYEKTQRYLVTIVASVRIASLCLDTWGVGLYRTLLLDRPRNSSEKFSSTTTLTVNVNDDDDQDPSFIYKGCMLLEGACINPEYSASVSSGVLAGVLNIHPEKIQAVDMDSINAAIEYGFLSGTPSNYADYFHINPTTGVVRQIRPVDTSVTKNFDIIVKAEEVTEARRFATAKLSVTVKPVDVNPPQIHATAVEGMVMENAPVGTKVVDKNGAPIHLTVTDPDLGPEDPKPAYAFELTTDFFRIDDEGLLVVNQENLDRDPPSPGKFRFQVVAREKSNNGNAASTPLAITVFLEDVNDNAPTLQMLPPITVEAGEGKREVVQVEATDNDYGENAVISYSIYHVSNNGRGKFKIDPHTGLLTTSGKLIAGEQYSITVQATDTGGKLSQTIVEVTIIPGPNTRSPIFSQPVYDLQVSEGASINSTVATIIAVDPEKDPVTYSILTGNDLRQFSIGYNSGVISVIRKLDREDLTRYQLLIKAEDTGGLSSTATVNIKVTDINDKNPEFVDTPYEFKVKEREANKTVGSVRAIDSDEGINAMVTYSLPKDIPFVINETTGVIKTAVALDYENQKEHKFVVTAKDGAPDPRLATATVTVQVQDIEDEVPTFSILQYKSRVPENVPGYMIIRVKADDRDTVKKITYVIKQGPTDIFTVDPQTGELKCTKGLDYERESNYTIIIGTVENQSQEPGATTKVIIQVEDRNDIPPVFTTVPKPLTLDDEVSIGTPILTLTATDSDGTPPGNKVRYELIGRRKASKYFQIDPDTGVLQVRDDLRKETDTEYQVDVKAYDLGEPSLSSVTTVPIYVKHTATVPPEIGLGFADDFYSIEVPENATARQLIKTLLVINGRAHNGGVPLKCDIISGNNEGITKSVSSRLGVVPSSTSVQKGFYSNHRILSPPVTCSDPPNSFPLFTMPCKLSSLPFSSSLSSSPGSNHLSALNARLFYTNITAERNCEVRLKLSKLDHEVTDQYQLNIKLDTLSGLVNPEKSLTTLKIHVTDINDNAPEFVFPQAKYKSPTPNVYYAAIAKDSQFGTNVLTVKAVDKDSGKFSSVSYGIVPNDRGSEYFAIDNVTGVVRTKKLVDSVDKGNLPLTFKVLARDNYLSPSNSNTNEAKVVVNLIDNEHRLILVLEDAKRDAVQESKTDIEEILQEHSGLIVGIEKFAPKQYLNENKTLESDNSATDIWFYAIDPETETILDVNQTKLQRSILDKGVMSNITFDVSGNIQVTASMIHGPLVETKQRTAIAAVTWDIFPYTIIVIACLILVLGIVGIIYICISWSRYKAFKERMQRSYVVPRYDPVFVEPNNLKEYETQVLQMSVPLDDSESYNDLQLDFSAKNHAFSMENVSYITKENNRSGGQSPVSFDAGTTARTSTLSGGMGHHNNLLNNHDFQNTHYQRSPDDSISHNLNISSTNDNVLFREKKDFNTHMSYKSDRSPVETTTEL
ncbi:hypothetical protein RUM44_009304 [Polyplax serrata]|uniref:Cadherin domain-containing protein n=1 Tax=Polyplax serrata TaxID=468196 RepID=A0ABR1ASA7_POLSC